MLKYFLSILLIISVLDSFSQNSFPLEKQKLKPELWLFGNANYHFEKGSFFFVRWQAKHSTSPFDDAVFYESELQLNYIQKLTSHWQLGIGARYTDQSTTNIFSPQVFLRHQGALGSIQFLKQLSLQSELYSNPILEDVAATKFGLSVFRKFMIGQKEWYPILNYELYKILDKKDDQENQRHIDQTRLRLDLVYVFSPKIQFSLFASRETNYFFALAQFEQDASGQIVMSKPERRLNLITPVYGMGFYVSFGSSKRKFEVLLF